MNITAMRRNPRGDEPVATLAPDAIDAPLAAADHVINILPDNPASVNFIDAARLGRMKPGVVLHNIGRGTSVDQDALLAALRSGHVSAAWLDVTDPEPLPAGHPLRAEARCHITPHTAGGHGDESGTLVRHFLANLRRYESGQPLRDRIM
jgi:phosphoglycerate dehydrogenase-like enzyme